MAGIIPGGNLGLALIRDGNGPRSFDTLLRYRGGALAELWRALRTLKALQAERREARAQPAVAPAPRLLPEPHEVPIEPEARATPREITCAPTTGKAVATVVPAALPEEPPAHCGKPIEPEARGHPSGIAPAPAAGSGRGREHEDRETQLHGASAHR